MSRGFQKIKSYKLPEKEVRPLKNKFVTTINAGLASAGPPLGPLLGKYGLNIVNFVKDFNNKSSLYNQGIPLPTLVTVNPDRTWEITFLTPDVDYYLMQAAGINSFERYNGISGKLTRKHIYEIAKIKHEDPHSYVQLDSLKDVVAKYFRVAHINGIEIVDKIDPVEYDQFLKEKKEYLAKLAEELEAERQAKLLRA